MENKERPECELLLFHSTSKENLKGIMKDGLRPGMKGVKRISKVKVKIK
jgi:RNA:NAD 2'-phosphotransferase (TPT1/KptA family)